MFTANVNGVTDENSSYDFPPEISITRKPLFIFKQLKNAKHNKEKSRLNERLKALKDNFDEGFKIGAAVGKRDSFFDALAQALNELKDCGQMFVKKDINVTYLRHLCQQYAIEIPKGAWLDEALNEVGLERDEYISHIILTDEETKSAYDAKVALRGTLEIEGKLLCEMLGVKIKLFELSEVDADTAGFCLSRKKVGKGKNMVYLLKHGNHFVPLLSNLNENVAVKIIMTKKEVYGLKTGKRRHVDLKQEHNISFKKARLDSETNQTEIEFSISNGLHSTLKGEVQELAPDNIANDFKDFINRKPLPIFTRLERAADEAEKRKLKKILKSLKENLPEGFKIAAAVAGADSFFDALAQSLWELSYKGLISLDEGFNLRNLRKICRQHAVQAQNDAWLSAALERVGENLAYYKKHIEFSVVDFKNAACSGNAIAGRLKIEGKIISQQLDVKIKMLELTVDEDGVLNITREKVGKGKKLVYLLKYQNHFVPLLSNIDADLTDKINVPKAAVYGENKKRRSSVLEPETHATKRARFDLASNDACIETLNDLQVPEEQAINSKTTSLILQTATKNFEVYMPNFRAIPYRLLGLLYHLDLSALCLLRNTLFQNKYASVTLTFGGAEFEKFKDIFINYKNKSICIQIEYVDNYYMDNDINFGKLFAKEKRSFSLNYYFENFVKYFHEKPGNSIDDIQYLVIYTNAALELTEDNKLKRGRFRDFCAFKFVELKKCRILKRFLCTEEQMKGRGFYQFSNDEQTRAEILRRLKFSNSIENDLKAQFLEKLLFAVKQPEREELNCFIRNEIKNKQIIETDYIGLQKDALNILADNKKQVPRFIYEFNLLLSFLRDMLLKNNKIASINCASYDKNNDIILNYGDKMCYVKVFHSVKSIGYCQLFPNKNQNGFSLNNCFQLYLENMQKFQNLTYFIIYTNASLNLTEENVFNPDVTIVLHIGHLKNAFFRFFFSI